MAWLSFLLFLLTLGSVEETYTASCSYGSPCQKELRFLTCNMKPAGNCRPYTRDHQHVRIQGQLTKGSAVYCPRLVEAIAEMFEASNWISLFLGLSTQHGLGLSAISLPCVRAQSIRPPSNLHQHLLDFDATWGFPGEGPRFSLVVVVWILVVGFGFCHGMVPRNREDEIRATRRTGKCLAEGRPVERLTKTNRKNCWRLLNFGYLKEVFRGKIF